MQGTLRGDPGGVRGPGRAAPQKWWAKERWTDHPVLLMGICEGSSGRSSVRRRRQQGLRPDCGP
eukprot:1178115-Prorocentrum_minimum.AAC.1